jgi:hypothetical protein
MTLHERAERVREARPLQAGPQVRRDPQASRGRFAHLSPLRRDPLRPLPRETQGCSVIAYHGAPITPVDVARQLWTRRHAFVSFEHPEQLEVAAEVAQTFALDNGAFSAWGKGRTVDVPAYAEWVNHWRKHPGFDFAVIPDAIDGDEAENDRLLGWWHNCGGDLSVDVPVWHLHESVDRFALLCHNFRRVALGSSGVYATPGVPLWWVRIGEAMDRVCDEQGRPPCKLHGLRMLDPTVFSQLPLSSADSTNVARNIGIDAKWDRAPYAPRSKVMRAFIIADRIEHHASAATWQRTYGTQQNLELIG